MFFNGASKEHHSLIEQQVDNDVGQSEKALDKAEPSELENMERPDQLPTSSISSSGLDRRFGFFKKGHHRNNNLRFSYFGGYGNMAGKTFNSAYFNECESCLANIGSPSMNSQNSLFACLILI